MATPVAAPRTAAPAASHQSMSKMLLAVALARQDGASKLADAVETAGFLISPAWLAKPSKISDTAAVVNGMKMSILGCRNSSPIRGCVSLAGDPPAARGVLRRPKPVGCCVMDVDRSMESIRSRHLSDARFRMSKVSPGIRGLPARGELKPLMNPSRQGENLH